MLTVSKKYYCLGDNSENSGIIANKIYWDMA
jgi:hypothetical protein